MQKYRYGFSSSLVNKRFISLLRPEHIRNPTVKDDSSLTRLFKASGEAGLVENGTGTKFDVIGEPSTMAALSIAPEIPLYIRRGSLIAISKNSSNSATVISFHWKFFWHNMINYANFSSTIYQKLKCKDRLNLLVSANFFQFKWIPFLKNTNEFRTLSTLKLNGATDWLIWGKNSIVAFEDNTSLNIKPSRYRFFRRKLPFSNKFKVVKGRGNVLLSGNGSIYAIDLKDNSEEIIIKPEHLLAINGNNEIDIGNSVESHELASLEKIEREKLALTVQQAESFGVKEWMAYNKKVFTAMFDWTYRKYYHFLNGSNVFLKIKGPRTILIQTTNNMYLPNIVQNGNQTTNGEKRETQPKRNSIVTEKQSLLESENRLKEELKYTSVVTIDTKGTNFKSTKSF